MHRLTLLTATLLLACVTNARAGTYENCNQNTDVSLRHLSCLEVLNDEAESRDHKAVAFVRLCKVYADRTNLSLSRTYCTKAAAQTSFAENYVNLGSAEFENGNYPEALEYFQKAVAMNPNLPEAQDNLLVARRKMEEKKAVAVVAPKP